MTTTTTLLLGDNTPYTTVAEPPSPANEDTHADNIAGVQGGRQAALPGRGKQWARNAELAFEPPHGTIVQMMETAGSKAGAFYKYNTARAMWVECEPPTAT